MLYIIIFSLLIYFIARISVLAMYIIANNNFNKESFHQRQLEIEHEKEMTKNLQNFTGSFSESIPFPPHLPYISDKSKNKWIFLYRLDLKIKSLGTISLSILSIILIVYKISELNKTLLLAIAILPSAVQLFNEILSWFAIEKPVGFEPILPKRFLAKKSKKT